VSVEIYLFIYPLFRNHNASLISALHWTRIISEEKAETSPILFQGTDVLPNDLAMRNVTDRTGDKLIAVCTQTNSGVSAINPLVAF
jgi:hypothetical protein